MIDCLLIGYNEMELVDYVNSVKQFGEDSGAFRDLRLNYIKYNNELYDIGRVFNSCTKDLDRVEPLMFSESFSATISYLGSFLHKNGLSFDYIQNFQYEKEKLIKLLVENEVLTICISTTYFVSLFPILEMIEFIRKYNKVVKIIVGGPYISAQARNLDEFELNLTFEYMNADICIYDSQGEYALVQVIRAIKQSTSMDSIANVYFKNGDGYQYTFCEPEDNKLVDNPVNWDLFKNDIQEWLNLRTSISCPFNCSFCGSPKYQGGYQTASINHIEKDLNKLNTIEKLKSVHFIEDTLNFPPKRFKELLKMMVKNKYKFKWHSYYRCQFADRETIELMKESGCEAVYLGLESGSDKILENMNKATTVDKYLKGIELLKEYDILTHGNFIIGFPGETEETVLETKKFIQNCGIDYYRMQLWYCMPITPIWERKDEFKIVGNGFEWEHSTMNSKKACDLLEEIYLTVRNPVWIPQLNFDINGLIHILHRGIKHDKLKLFIESFNKMIRQNILANKELNVSEDQYNEVKAYLMKDMRKLKEGIIS